jgi:hypothetical protein
VAAEIGLEACFCNPSKRICQGRKGDVCGDIKGKKDKLENKLLTSYFVRLGLNAIHGISKF